MSAAFPRPGAPDCRVCGVAQGRHKSWCDSPLEALDTLARGEATSAPRKVLAASLAERSPLLAEKREGAPLALYRYRVWLADRVEGFHDARPAFPNVCAADVQGAAEFWAASFFHTTDARKVPDACRVWVQRDGESARDAVTVHAVREVHFCAESAK